MKTTKRLRQHHKGEGEMVVLIIVAVLIVIGLLAVAALFWLRRGENPNAATPEAAVESVESAPTQVDSNLDETAEPEAEIVKEPAPESRTDLAAPIRERNPEAEIRSRLEALAREAAEESAAGGQGGQGGDDPESGAATALWASLPEDLRQQLPEEVRSALKSGELRLAGEPRLAVDGRARQRWELPLKDSSGSLSRLNLDYELGEDRAWQLAKLGVGGQDRDAGTGDALMVAEDFIQNLRDLNVERARAHARSGAVSNAQLAALCILFEDGIFQLSDDPLKLTIERPGVRAFVTNLESLSAGSNRSQLAFVMQEAEEGTKRWEVIELSFDQALVDYASATEAGDTYYTPLVENPQGGESLALYFDFDEADLNQRARRQLEIVAQLLAEDSERKLVISGHTDAKGSAGYNEQLGLQRASDVRDFLVEQGLPADQIELQSFGASRPRASNLTSSGEDNPDGRQANRRAEIYLDF